MGRTCTHFVSVAILNAQSDCIAPILYLSCWAPVGTPLRNGVFLYQQNSNNYGITLHFLLSYHSNVITNRFGSFIIPFRFCPPVGGAVSDMCIIKYSTQDQGSSLALVSAVTLLKELGASVGGGSTLKIPCKKTPLPSFKGWHAVQPLTPWLLCSNYLDSQPWKE